MTFNAVGSGTTVENLEVYAAYDDGVEFFGGAVNITNYVALFVRDDSIDFSDGYSGTINNALIIHSPTDGNRCIEGDNVASTRLAGGASQTPLTRPTIRHMTCIPSNFDVGTHGDSEGPVIRYGARMILSDSIIDGGRATAKLALPSNECFELDRDLNNDTSTAAQAGESTLNRTVISCQEAYVSGTADNLVNGDTGLQWIAGAGTAATYPFNTFNVVITDPANANVRVLQPNTFFSYDENAAAETVTIRDAANVAVNIGAVGNAVTDGYIGAVRSTAELDGQLDLRHQRRQSRRDSLVGMSAPAAWSSDTREHICMRNRYGSADTAASETVGLARCGARELARRQTATARSGTDRRRAAAAAAVSRRRTPRRSRRS